jgi:hypothetical protein
MDNFLDFYMDIIVEGFHKLKHTFKLLLKLLLKLLKDGENSIAKRCMRYLPNTKTKSLVVLLVFSSSFISLSRSYVIST